MHRHIFNCGDLELEGGGTLLNASLVYATWGVLNEAGDNALILPAFVAGTPEGYLPFIGPECAFDPDRYFIVAPNLFGGGLSTSPSNAAESQRGPLFPSVSVNDNVRAQRILADALGVRRFAMAAGYSLGAQQSLAWAMIFPDMVERVAAWCGTARSSAHTVLVFEAMRAVLAGSPDFAEGSYSEPPSIGLRLLARVYAPWALSQAWYRAAGWKRLGFPTLDTFMVNFWDATMVGLEANDFLIQISTLQGAGSAPRSDSDWMEALAAIRIPVLLMPSSSDLYFPAEEAAETASMIEHGACIPVESDWGHFAGMGLDAIATQHINARIARLLEAPAPRSSGTELTL